VSELQAFLDQGTSFEGKVTFRGLVRIDGHFRGEAHADGTLVVGSTGLVEADLEVHALVVEGRVSGNVIARDRVELAPGARLEGGLETARLLVAEGAEICARVRMTAKPQPAAAQEPMRPARTG
jgi:cytoskeletal protein CcmA (bactofilin family)